MFFFFTATGQLHAGLVMRRFTGCTAVTAAVVVGAVLPLLPTAEGWDDDAAEALRKKADALKKQGQMQPALETMADALASAGPANVKVSPRQTPYLFGAVSRLVLGSWRATPHARNRSNAEFGFECFV